jgi:hypothetical protein
MALDNIHSRLTIHDSRFTIHDSRFTIHHSRFTNYYSPFTIHHSPLTIHDLLFTILEVSMRFSLSFSTFLILALAVFTACQTSAPGPSEGVPEVAKSEPSPLESRTPAGNAVAVDEDGHSDSAPRVALADAKAAFDKGDTLFIDTRAQVAWLNERIKGSVNIPMETFEQRFEKEVPKGKPIIAYCS